MTEEAGTKRVNEGGNSWEGGKKMRGENLTLRFLLNSKHAGGIIGKGGETIKRLRNDFSANVTVPDTTTRERVLTIASDQGNCIQVLRECLPLVHEAPYPVNSRSDSANQFEIDFLVHSSQAGGIIGKAGYKIKQIREETSANIKVYGECLPDSTERVVAVGGTEDQLIAAIEQMIKVMEENPIKGTISLYDPSYDHSGGYSYDGYNNSYNSAPYQGGMRGGGRGGRGGGPQGRYGGGMNQSDNFTGDNYAADTFLNNNWNQTQPMQDFNYGSGSGGNQQVSDSFGAPVDNTMSDGSSTQVTVSNDMAGAIIGRGGERIRQIRAKSGADIKFSDSEQGKTERLITISGSHNQIQHAQYLMQQCVREHHKPGR